jgi:uncharacterized protein YwgA
MITTLNENELEFDNFDLARVILLLGSQKSGEERIFKGTTSLQKLVFLCQQFDEFKLLKEKGTYKDSFGEFKYEADNFGPFSKDLLLVLKRMKKNGEIDIKNGSYCVEYVIKEGLKTKSDKIKILLDKNPVFKTWCDKIYTKSKLSLDSLLREVYSNPKNSSLLAKSKIKDKVLGEKS